MMVMTILGVLTGAVLGMRLRVLILIPAIGLTLASIGSFAIVADLGLWPTVIAMIVASMGLQVGYIAGSVVATIQTASLAHAKSTPLQTQAGPLSQ
jgi:hypothetical protein